MKKVASKLDWTRMLGFEQIADNRLGSQDEKLNAKVGLKVGAKIGLKAGLKV